jgi:hypothetical protein
MDLPCNLMLDALSSNIMRTTVDIDVDGLQAIKERAMREGKTMSQLVSEAIRAYLNAPRTPAPVAEQPRALYGFRPIPKGGGIVTNEHINKLREDDVY